MFYLKRLKTPEEKFEASKLHFRPSDIVEFTGATGLPWEFGYTQALKESDMLWGGINLKGNMVCAGGFIITPKVLVPWFAGTEESVSETLGWCRLGRDLTKLFKTFELPMSNYVWIENKTTMKWLKILGFKIDKSKEHEFYFGVKFYEFYMGKKREEVLNV